MDQPVDHDRTLRFCKDPATTIATGRYRQTPAINSPVAGWASPEIHTSSCSMALPIASIRSAAAAPAGSVDAPQAGSSTRFGQTEVGGEPSSRFAGLTNAASWSVSANPTLPPAGGVTRACAALIRTAGIDPPRRSPESALCRPRLALPASGLPRNVSVAAGALRSHARAEARLPPWRWHRCCRRPSRTAPPRLPQPVGTPHQCCPVCEPARICTVRGREQAAAGRRRGSSGRGRPTAVPATLAHATRLQGHGAADVSPGDAAERVAAWRFW